MMTEMKFDADAIDEILKRDLTPSQYSAAVDPAKDILTLACAGSGKSRTLAYRIARLVAEGANPSGIVAFTFTEKASEAIKLRVSQALEKAGQEPMAIGRMFIGTIHAFCQATLSQVDAKYRQFDVLDENRLKLYVMSRYGQLGLATFNGRRPGTYFDYVTNLCESWQTLNDELLEIDDVIRRDALVGRVLEKLRVGLNEDEYIDFSAMVRLVVEALRTADPNAEAAVAGLRHLLVDEYQDVNPAQEALIRELHQRCDSLFVVGDDDQAIYGWRGADVTNIQSFEGRFPGASVHRLSVNFRSTAAIVSLANEFAKQTLGASRTPKEPVAAESRSPRDLRTLWFSDRASEAKWVTERMAALLGSEYQEPDGRIRGLTPADFAILMRSTRTTEQNGDPRHRAFTTALTNLRIPYSLEAGGDVFDRPQVRVLRMTFDLLRSRPDAAAIAQFFRAELRLAYPLADFAAFLEVMTRWGAQLHGQSAPRLYPQQLVHQILAASQLAATAFDAGTMQDIGVFSRMIQDVETTYVSVASLSQFGEVCDFLRELADRGYNSATAEVLRRPDTVSVATVHKVKGLEFPVVFVVDVEAARFPRRRQGYSGWLPASVLAGALARGAYQGTAQEEARLFYTALTRAERYLYVTGCENLPAAARPRKESSYVSALRHDELTKDTDTLPVGLRPAQQVRRIDETVLPTNYSEIRYYLRCPRDYQFRRVFGFSPPITEMFGFGRSVHAAIGKLHERHPEQAPDSVAAGAIARDTLHLKHVARSGDPDNRPGPYEEAIDAATQILRTYAASHSTDFQRKRQLEVRFEIPLEKSVISGTIDLLLHEDDRGHILDAVVVDFKTMEGGPDPEGNERLHWTELSLQVQLYAKAALEVLGQNAATGAVHLLKDDRRVEIPVTPDAIAAAVSNVEWAVDRIIVGDFPMRPAAEKCAACDFRLLCPQQVQPFAAQARPLPLVIPGEARQMARAFSECDGEEPASAL